MAEPSKPKRTRSPRKKTTSADKKPVEEAVVVEESAPEAAAEEPVKDADSSVSTDEAAPESEETADPVQEPIKGPAETFAPVDTATSVATEPEPRRFMPMFLGGVFAAGLGALALFLAQDRGWLNLGSTDVLEAQIGEQAAKIEALEAALDSATGEIKALKEAMPDGAVIDAALTELRSADSTARAELTETAAALRTRINQVEVQPIPKAQLPDEIVNAYDRQLAEVLGTMDARFGKMQTALDEQMAKIEAAQTLAASAEQDALRAADAADVRAALARVAIALESGSGFADELALIVDKGGPAVPATLQAVAADGAPTLAALEDTFPEAARAALAAATKAQAADGEVGTLTSFLRTQLGARSLEPREGDDPDAVLSRAEAAVKAGNLDTALSEIAALPQAGRQALADWKTLAETRSAALVGVAAMSAELDAN